MFWYWENLSEIFDNRVYIFEFEWVSCGCEVCFDFYWRKGKRVWYLVGIRVINC